MIPSEKDLNLNFIARFFYRRETNRQLKESLSFLDALKSLSGPEMGELLLLATHIRHGLEQSGCNVLTPLEVRLTQPHATSNMIKQVQMFKQARNDTAAAAMMVWALSTRATSCQELFGTGRDIWTELSRGKPYLQVAREKAALSGLHVDIKDADQTPYIFTLQ